MATDDVLEGARVLVIDDDHDVAEVVSAILGDEGYQVTVLERVTDETVRAAIGRLEPDCVLLDGVRGSEYAEAWVTAAEMSHRARPIPAIMFTAHSLEAAEATEATTDRAVAAGFAAILRKPFTLDDLVATVHEAIASGIPFNHSVGADRRRTADLVARLTAAGARNVLPSKRREWATFEGLGGSQMQLYWWQGAGAYLVGRYDADGGQFELMGRFFDLGEAIAVATGGIPEGR